MTIKAVKGSESFTDLENYFGRALIERKSPLLKEFAEEEHNKILNVLENMKSNNKTEDIRYKELTRLLKLYEEVFKCL